MSTFADRYVTVADPLKIFDDVYIQVIAVVFASTVLKKITPPPGDWTFERLQLHFVEILAEYGALAAGEAPPSEVEPTDDLNKAFAAAGRKARNAFKRPGYLHEVAETPLGPQPGSVVVQHVINELVTHSWDMGRCLDRTPKFPDWLPERCQLSWSVFFEEYGRPEVNFEPEQVAPAGASSLDRLAAFLGRKVS